MKATTSMLLLLLLLTICSKMPIPQKKPGNQASAGGHSQVDTRATRVKLQFAGSDSGTINYLHTTSQTIHGDKVSYVDAHSFSVLMIDSLMGTLSYERRLLIMQMLDTLAKKGELRGHFMDAAEKDGKQVTQPIGDFDLTITGGNYLNGSINICNTSDRYGERTGLIFSNCSVIFVCKDADHGGMAHFSCNRREMDSIVKVNHCKKVRILF